MIAPDMIPGRYVSRVAEALPVSANRRDMRLNPQNLRVRYSVPLSIL